MHYFAAEVHNLIAASSKVSEEGSLKILCCQDVSMRSFATAQIDFVRNLGYPVSTGIECLEKSRFGATHLRTEPFQSIRSHEE